MTDMAFPNGGQWIGRTFGETPGFIMLELEPHGDRLKGLAYQFPDNPEVMAAAVEIDMARGGPWFEGKALPVILFRPGDGYVFPYERRHEVFPHADASAEADVTLDLSSDPPSFEFTTKLTADGGPMILGHQTPTSERSAVSMSWDDFRTWAFEQPPRQKLYRGQQEPWKLRTSFHRTPRKVLHRYRSECIPELHRLITGQHDLDFDLTEPDEAGAFYNLLRHHGYPTPLLDWSQSPFVAAFFAFDGLSPSATEGHIRLHILDAHRWTQDLPQLSTLAFAAPHFSILALGTRGNPRAVPQQAVPTLTNVDDIEFYISLIEMMRGTTYLEVIDVPVTDRGKAMNDLLLMGIHAGSLMPGLDGTCRAMAFRHFPPAI